VDADYAARYQDLQRWHWWFRGRERILGHVLARESGRAAGAGASPSPRGWRRLLSVGCGPPEGLAWLTPFVAPGGVVVGLDADPAGALQEASAGRRTPPPSVRFVLGRMEAPPLRPGSCDAVLALDVLEHVADDSAALARIGELLAPTGLLVVTVPALPTLWGVQDRVSHHHRRYTRRSLAEAFRRAGLPRPRLAYFNTLLFLPIASLRWTRRLTGRLDQATSDFDGSRPGPWNELLARIFAAERHLVGRVRLPVGVSLLAVGRAGAGEGVTPARDGAAPSAGS
jgi:SAM-dependent methyltransferase